VADRPLSKSDHFRLIVINPEIQDSLLAASWALVRFLEQCREHSLKNFCYLDVILVTPNVQFDRAFKYTFRFFLWDHALTKEMQDHPARYKELRQERFKDFWRT